MGVLRAGRRCKQKGDSGSDKSYNELLEECKRNHIHITWEARSVFAVKHIQHSLDSQTRHVVSADLMLITSSTSQSFHFSRLIECACVVHSEIKDTLRCMEYAVLRRSQGE